MPTKKLVHLVPDRLVDTTGAYHYSETVPNMEQDVDAEAAAELIASGAFHDAAKVTFRAEDPPPIPEPEPQPEGPAPAGPLDSAAESAEKEI